MIALILSCSISSAHFEGELHINQGNKLKDELANQERAAHCLGPGVWGGGAAGATQKAGAAHKPPACPQSYRLTSSWLLGSNVFPYTRPFYAWCKHCEDCGSTIFCRKTQIPRVLLYLTAL